MCGLRWCNELHPTGKENNNKIKKIESRESRTFTTESGEEERGEGRVKLRGWMVGIPKGSGKKEGR